MWTFVHGPKTVSHVIDEHIAPPKKQASWYTYPIHISQNMDETTQAYPNKYHIILEHMGLSQNPTLLSPCCWQMDGSIPMLCPHEIPNMLYIVPIQSWFSMSIWCSLQNIHRWCKNTPSSIQLTFFVDQRHCQHGDQQPAQPAAGLPAAKTPASPASPAIPRWWSHGGGGNSFRWWLSPTRARMVFFSSSIILVGGWPIPLKNISHLGWLSHILWKIKMFETTNQQHYYLEFIVLLSWLLSNPVYYLMICLSEYDHYHFENYNVPWAACPFSTRSFNSEHIFISPPALVIMAQDISKLCVSA